MTSSPHTPPTSNRMLNDILEDSMEDIQFSTASLTTPHEFEFELDKRRPESRTQDYLLQIQEKMMDECTFRPSVRPLPSNLYNRSKYESVTSKPFFDRVMAWKEKQKKSAQEKLREVKDSELENCTFHPSVNPMISSNSFLSDGDLQALNRFNIHDKLYEEASRQAKKKEEYSKRETEERLKKECTFRPRISYNKHISPRVTPRYQESRRMDPRIVQHHMEQQESECTFKPRINSLSKNKFSSGSQLYLSTDAFERLSRAHTPRPSMSARDSLNTSPAQPTQKSAPTSARRHTFGTSGDSSGFKNSRPQSARRTSEMSFQQFWERHQGREKKKQQRLSFIASSMESKHQPQLNKKSLNMVRSRADFLERMEHHLSKKKDRLVNHQTQQEKECTFQPKINSTSKRMPPRSVEDLSRGDWERTQKKNMELAQMLEKKKMSEYSFQPEKVGGGNKKYKVQSFLKLKEDPDNYMKRLKEMEDRKKSRMENLKLEMESKELKDCTFQPKIHDAPDYVKRIAETMQLTRSKTSPQKPDWR